MPRFIVLQTIDNGPGIMDSYGPQVATVQEYESAEEAAAFNVGSYPDYDERGKPYRSVVIPEEAWQEFDVHADRIEGQRTFVAYPVDADDRTIR